MNGAIILAVRERMRGYIAKRVGQEAGPLCEAYLHEQIENYATQLEQVGGHAYASWLRQRLQRDTGENWRVDTRTMNAIGIVKDAVNSGRLRW